MRKKLLVMFLIVALFTGVYSALADELGQIKDCLSVVTQILQHIQNDYVEVIPNLKERFIYPAINDGLKHLDRYSRLLTPKQYQDWQTDNLKSQTEIVGIGALLEKTDTGEIIIHKVIPGGPAERAGILKNDILLAVDGVDLDKEISLDAVVQKIRGKKGTAVTLKIKRANQALTFNISRDTIIIKNITFKVLANNIGYININTFNLSAAADFRAALLNIGKADGLIIDLRDNPGGLIDVVNKIIDEILPANKLIVTFDGAKGWKKDYYTLDDRAWSKPLVILVSDYSASASEVMAGCLKDHKAAILVGEKTYGKGCVQTIFNLSDGSALFLTTFQWYLPSGICISDKGIEPQAQADPDNDEEILKKAFEVLKNFKKYIE